MIPIFEKAHQLDLTGTEEEILQYFESNLPASIYTSLNDLSASLYTSNATIVRFCQKLGLKGYNEFSASTPKKCPIVTAARALGKLYSPISRVCTW